MGFYGRKVHGSRLSKELEYLGECRHIWFQSSIIRFLGYRFFTVDHKVSRISLQLIMRGLGYLFYSTICAHSCLRMLLFSLLFPSCSFDGYLSRILLSAL